MFHEKYNAQLISHASFSELDTNFAEAVEAYLSQTVDIVLCRIWWASFILLLGILDRKIGSFIDFK